MISRVYKRIPLSNVPTTAVSRIPSFSLQQERAPAPEASFSERECAGWRGAYRPYITEPPQVRCGYIYIYIFIYLFIYIFIFLYYIYSCITLYNTIFTIYTIYNIHTYINTYIHTYTHTYIQYVQNLPYTYTLYTIYCILYIESNMLVGFP